MSWQSMVPRLSDSVVTLRAHAEDDVPAMVEACRDPESVRWTRVPNDYTPDHGKRFVRHIKREGWENDSEWGFAVEAADESGTPRWIGNLDLRNEGFDRAEIAYLAHPWARGRGLMERAARLALAWGFEAKGIRTVIWYAHVGNWASRRLAWKVGFTVHGTLPAWYDHRGDLRDAWVGTVRRGASLTPARPWLTAPRIVGRNLVLRPLQEDDAPRIVEACTDPVTRAWLGRMPDPYDETTALAFVEETRARAADGAAVTWAIADPDDDRLLGVVNVFDLKEVSGEVGYWVHPDARGRGVATEATRLALRHGFIEADDGGLGLTTIRAFAAPGNEASNAVLRNAGMRTAGTARNNTTLGDGSRGDTIAYDMVAGELTTD